MRQGPGRAVLLTGLIAVVLIMGLLTAPLSRPLGADVGDDAWELMHSGTSGILLGVWGNADDDVFAVGYDGAILHYDGISWSTMTSGTSNTLWGVWGSAGNNVFAVGCWGDVIWHYDGISWSTMTTGADNSLFSVWGSAEDDVFAVGHAGTIVHYDGSNWSQMSSGTPQRLDAVWGSAGDDVFAVGELILHYDGSSWSPMSSGTTQRLFAVWGSAEDDVFAVGDQGTIVHYDGSSWSPMSSGTSTWLCGVWGSAGNDVFAVGDHGTILHYDGSSWSPMTSSTSRSLRDVGGISGSNVVAVGLFETIVHYPAVVNEVAGTWAAMSISGSGTFNTGNGDVTGGTVDIEVDITGDINGTFQYSAALYPGESWHGTSAAVNGTVTIDGLDHPATLWLKGDFTSFDLTGGVPPTTPPTGWECDLLCTVGDTHGWTTDGSDIAADFGWSGSCSGPVDINLGAGTWQVTGGSGSGSWNGLATECLAGRTEYVGSGAGTVVLPGSKLAEIVYAASMDGMFILAQYNSNPGDTPIKQTLDKYIQVDSSIVGPEITWSGVELRVYYTDAQLSAAGIDESTLKMHRWDGANWTEVVDSGVNTDDNYVWAGLTSFSAYSPMGDQSTTAPTVTTEAATLIEETTATLNGQVSNDGGEACEYRFEYDVDSGEPYASSTNWTDNIITAQLFSQAIPGLSKGTTYYFRAQARNSAGTGSGAELALLTRPDAPTGFNATTANSTRIDLSWVKGDGAQKTKIQRKEGGYPADRDDGTEVYFDTGVSTSDTGLTQGMTYYYRAWSYVQGSEQWSVEYAEASATIIGPPEVTTDTAAPVEETTAILNGQVSNDGGEVCQYRFEYDTDSGEPYAHSTAWTGNKTSSQSFNEGISSLAKGTTYYFRAQARNSAGTGSGAELALLTKPDAPSGLAASAAGATQIDLSWTKGDGAQKTKIQRKEGGYPADKNDGTEVYFDTGVGASDTELTPGTTYYYRAWSQVTGSTQWSDGYAQDTTTTGLEGATISGKTGEANCAVLSVVTIELWEGAVLIDTVTSDGSGNYEIIAPDIGTYDVVAKKTDFKDETRTVNVADIELEYTLDFIGETGMVPSAATMAYVLECVNHWLYPPGDECDLSMAKVLATVNAWLYPT